MDTAVQPDVTIRIGPRPGDLGTVLAMHGEIYAREFAFSAEFEAHVAEAVAAFAAALGAAQDDPRRPEPGWLWVAERDGETLGTVALTDEGDGVAQLRWFLVAPHARGGLGHRLLDACLSHARAAGFRHVRLWTVDGLDAAAALYTKAGFHRTEQHPKRQWGIHLIYVRYDLDLRHRPRIRG